MPRRGQSIIQSINDLYSGIFHPYTNYVITQLCDHTDGADSGCNGEPFRQVISNTDTAFTVGVEEF